MPVNRLLMIFSIALPLSYGQVHLLTGSPSPSYGAETFAAALYRVEDRSIRQVGKDLVSQALGAEWFGLSYDWRKAVIVAQHNRNDADADSVIVIDFGSGRVAKRCRIPNPPETTLIYSWLADTPAGPSFEWLESGPDPIKDVVVRGMTLGSDPCEKSFARLSPDAIRYIVDSDGFAGIAGNMSPSPHIRADPEDESDKTGNVNAWIGGKPIQLGYQIPEALRKGMGIRTTNLMVNDFPRRCNNFCVNCFGSLAEELLFLG